MNIGEQYEIKSHSEVDLIIVVSGSLKIKYSYSSDKIMQLEDDLQSNGYIDINYWKTAKKNIHKITAKCEAEILFVPFITYDSIINVKSFQGLVLLRSDNCKLYYRLHPIFR
jgi:hypothetical protein